MQPTTSSATSSVSAAQRARSILAVAQDLWLEHDHVDAEPVLLTRHVVMPGGVLLVAAPEAARAGEVVTVRVTDVSTVAQPDRVRSHLRLTGTLLPYDGPAAPGLVEHLRGVDPEAAEPVLARIVPREVAVAPAATPGRSLVWEPVAVVDFGRSAPEPFVAQEHRWLPHLQQGHGEAVRALAERVLGELDATVRVCALGLDRFGVTLRLYAGPARWDVRCDFAHELECGRDVREAVTAVLQESRRP